MTGPHHSNRLPFSIYRPRRLVNIIFSTVSLLIIFNVLAFKSEKQAVIKYEPRFSKKDSLISQKAFLKVYTVLMSARCMNCHPSGDIPLQGEDSHLHLQGVKRGPDGTGLYALKCTNCHQEHNLPGPHMPPGNPNWRLPPANMRMVFQGRTPHQLALQLLNKKKNGGKTIKMLINHVTKDSLVLGGWTPGQGLSKPPLSHKEFINAFNEWINHGAISPDPERK